MKTKDKRYFFLLDFEKKTKEIISEARIEIKSIAALREILNLNKGEDKNLDNVYYLNKKQIDEIEKISNKKFYSKNFKAIKSWNKLRQVPYLIHTNYELTLMLEGRKPLSVFCDFYPTKFLKNIIKPFDEFVRAGRINRFYVDKIIPVNNRFDIKIDRIRYIYFTLPGEEWRVKFYMMLKEIENTIQWNEDLERIEGTLLGYSESQNEWWINHMYQGHAINSESAAATPSA